MKRGKLAAGVRGGPQRSKGAKVRVLSKVPHEREIQLLEIEPGKELE